MRPVKADIKYTEKKCRLLKKEGGFTLIEVLIAVTIFAVGMLAVAAMQTSAVRMNSSSGRLSELNTWGMDKLEELMGLPYNDAALNPALDPHQETTPDGFFSVTWNIAQDVVTPDTKRITLTVMGKGKRLQFVTIKSQSL